MNKVKSTPSAATGMDKPTSSTASGRVEDEEVKPYVLAGELGKGSFAVVYRGYHQESHEQVAIKTVSRSILTSKLFDNLQSEIDILKSLSHRHITKLIDIVRAERNIYLIMEFCSGGDLTNYIKKRGRVETLEYVPSPGAAPQYYPHPKVGGLDEIVVRSFLRQLARALKFLRTRNLIHRDIKPQNLLLKPPAPEELARGHPLGVPILKVADFGFARSLPNAMMAETLCGSPLYMAPEILRYEKYDAKADLWSVGAVLYEISFGKPPFRALNHIELLKKIEHTRYIKFPDEDPAYLDKDPSVKAAPEDIKRLIRLLLKRLPTERASFDDFFNSGALANSKFPRPPAPPKTVKKSEPAAPMTIRDEPVIIGTIRSKTKELSLQDSLPIEKHQISIPTDENREVGVPKFHFRRGSYRAEEVTPSADGQYREPQNVLHVVEANTDPKTQDNHRPLSTEASIIPGESEEDGLLRREYVLVGDARAIDFNKAVDEIKAAQRKPLRTRTSLSSPVLEKSPSTPSEVTSPTPSSANTAFPPPPNPFPPPLSSSPSRSSASALTKALSLASRKLFGTSTSRTAYLTDRSPSRSPRRQALLLPRTPEGEAPQVTSEEELLKSLEELAQKTDVLVRWADDMYEYVKAVPTKPLPRPIPVLRADGTMRKKKREVEAEFNAITCVEVYLTLMAFSQKGIDHLRMYSEQTKTHDPNGEFEMSQGFNDALIFFKELFLKCNDRAILVKTWLPEQPSETEMWLDQIVYDRALELSRRAARLELVNQKCSYHEIEQLYEESLWLLYALQDDVMQAGNPFAEEDKTTTATWITRTKERLERSRRRREALEQETATAQPPTVTY